MPSFKTKQQMSSFDVAAACLELDSQLRDYYIEKIYQTSPLILLFKLNKPGLPQRQLLIEAGKRIHLTKYIVEKPTKPSQFCAVLRKHLHNGRVKHVEQPDFERIINFHISTGKGSFTLVVEVFGKGNVLLTDGEGRVLQALSYRKMRDREITRGEKLISPPPSGLNPMQVSLETFTAKIKACEGEVVKALTKILSIGGLYAEELLLAAGIEKTVRCEELNNSTASRLYTALVEILRKIDDPKPVLVLDKEGKPVDVTPFPLLTYKGRRFEGYSNISEALDEYFTKTAFDDAAASRSAQLTIQLEEQRRIMEEQKARLKELETAERKAKEIGNLIFNHAGDLHTLTQWIQARRENGKGWPDITLEAQTQRSEGRNPFTYFSTLIPQQPALQVTMGQITFDVNLKQSVYENASRYYDEAKHLREKIAGLRAALEETAKKAEAKQLNIEAVQAAPPKPVRVREKRWYEKYRHFHSSEGFLVVAGKDTVSNEALVKRYTESSDLVFHTEIAGAPFAVIKTEGRTCTQPTILEAAQFTASYSRGWNEGLAAADVYYVKPEQLSKTAPSGQYLTRGAFTVTGQRNYLRNIPLRLALGVRMEEGEPQLVAGPVEAVKAAAKVYVEIAPGGERAREVAFKIRGIIAQQLSRDENEKFSRMPLESFIQHIPFGRARVTTKAAG